MLCNSREEFPESPPTSQMADEGFRQPQFSQDSAWLPSWLQTHFLECGIQPINGNSTSKIECKALGGFLGSIRHAEEATYGSPLEMVRRQICPLVLSGDDCTASNTSQSIANELAFHLSLSSENDMEIPATKAHATPSQEKHHFCFPLDKPEISSDRNTNFCPCPESSMVKNMTEDPMCNNVFHEEKIPIQDEYTPCTELYVPGNIYQGDNRNNTICGDSCNAAFFATASKLLDNKTSLSSARGTLNNEASGKPLREKQHCDMVRPPQEKRYCHVPLDKPEINNDTNQNVHPCPEMSMLKDVTGDLTSNNILPGEKILIQDEYTPCTELYIPGIIQQGDNTNNIIGGDSCNPTFFATASELLDNKTSLISPCGTLNDETCLPRQTIMGNVQNSLKRKSRKTKSFVKSEGQLRNKTSDIDVAIGLTVAAAEALVISDVLETCRLSERIGSSEILEAAIKLKQARQMCGLDTFSDFSSGPMDGVDDSCLDELDDDIMEDAFADVGFYAKTSTVSPFGLVSADMFESEAAKKFTHIENCSFLSSSKECGGVSEGASFTPSKLELKARGSDDKKDEGVLVSAATTYFPDTSVLRCLNRVNNTKGLQNDSMGKPQIVLEYAVGSTINNVVNTKPNESGLFAASITRSSERRLNRDMGFIRLEQKPPSTANLKYDNSTSLQTKFPSMENLVHCSHNSANEAVEIVIATPQCDNDAVDKGLNFESENEIANGVESNVTSSPSWLHLARNEVEEILSHDISQSSDSLEWQSQIQAGKYHIKESENVCNTQDTRILMTKCPRPFVSRWFGGWTGLDKEIETNKIFEVTVRVQKPFVEETSYLTESLDIDRGCAAPVQCFSSQVGKVSLNNIYPISDMYIHDLSSTNNKVSYSLTQNSARCSNSPLYDPLCSIVPCSIPQEDDLLTKRTDVEIWEVNPNSSSELHTNAFWQLHKGLPPLQEENKVQLSKPSEKDIFKDSGQARTCSISRESEFRAKRKRVDSLKQYSTLSGMLQDGSIELQCETKEAGFPGDTIIIHDSIERLKIDCPSADTVTHINGKKGVNKEAGPPRESVIQDSREKLTRVCLSADAGSGSPNNDSRKVVDKLSDIWLESAPLNLTRDMRNHNGSTEEETPGRKQNVFQDHYKYAVTINPIAAGNLRNHKDFDCKQKDSCNLGNEIDFILDVEESSPLLLHCRKRKRLKAARIIENGCEDSKWDKATSTCLNQTTAAVSGNVERFELVKNHLHFPDLYEQKLHEQMLSKQQGDHKNIKRVHFSEDTIENPIRIDNCQQDRPQNVSTCSSEKYKVCCDVSGPRNQFEASLRVQNAKVGKKIGDDCRRSKKEKNGQDLTFQGLEFFLKGLSTNKKTELEQLIREHGGVVLSNLPPLSHTLMRGRLKREHLDRNYPIILLSEQVRTTEFLYGCAVGSFLLQPNWITDSIAAKCRLPFDKYRLRSKALNTRQWGKQNHIDAIVENDIPLFSRMRIMLYGKPIFLFRARNSYK
ncbi:hypothetical protein KI387_024755, partial [Taxus chinensis]